MRVFCAERVVTRTSMVRERSERCKDAQTSRSKRRNVPRRKASAEQRRLVCAQNPYVKTASHRQTTPTAKRCRYFLPACPHPACAVLIYLLVTSAGRRARVGARLRPQRVLTLHARRANSSRNSALKTATHRQTNDSKTAVVFCRLAHLPVARSIFGLG